MPHKTDYKGSRTMAPPPFGGVPGKAAAPPKPVSTKPGVMSKHDVMAKPLVEPARAHVMKASGKGGKK